MKCKSCQEIVDPKFKHAISVNACPFCGQVIVDEKLQAILKQLAIVMGASSDYMEDVENWFQSNYSMVVLGADQVVVSKGDLPDGRQPVANPSGKAPSKFRHADDEDDASPSADESTELTSFAKRAGVNLQPKKAIDFIRGGIGYAADPSEFNEEEGQEIVGPPLRHNELDQLSDVLADSGGEDNNIHSSQLDKLKRLRTQTGGNFRR